MKSKCTTTVDIIIMVMMRVASNKNIIQEELSHTIYLLNTKDLLTLCITLMTGKWTEFSNSGSNFVGIERCTEKMFTNSVLQQKHEKNYPRGTYGIAGNFRGENFQESMKFKISRRKLSWVHHRLAIALDTPTIDEHAIIVCACVIKPTMPTPLFVEKNFTNGPRSTKFAKTFSLESFPLYGRISLTITIVISVN